MSDSEVDVPDDALSVSSNILLDGASVSDEEVPDEDASDRSTVSSDDADVAEGAEDSQPVTEASTEPGPNPFASVDAQNLATLDNYECENYSRVDKSLSMEDVRLLLPVRRCG